MQGYNDYWNYARDYASTKDKYFTSEERHLIQKCLESRQEEKAYLVEKRAWLGKLGSGLLETAEKMDAWGRSCAGEVLGEESVSGCMSGYHQGDVRKTAESRRRAEVQRDDQTVSGISAREEQIAELNRIYADTEKEAEELKMKLKTFSFQNDDFLSKKNDREIQELIRIMEQDVDGQNLLVLYLAAGKDRNGKNSVYQSV